MENKGEAGKNCYRIIAPYYDWIMSHVDYAKWAAYLQQLFSVLKCRPKTILELAAGTAPFLEENLFPESSLVVQSDISLEMLRQARFRETKNIHSTYFTVCDANRIPFKSGFDACLMNYDSLNYLSDMLSLRQVFREVSRVLQPGGHFIFDVTTEYNSKKFFMDTVEYEEDEDCVIIRQSLYVDSIKRQINKFTFFLQESDGRYSRSSETHIQRIFDHASLVKAAQQADLSLSGSWDNFSLNPVPANSERVHYAFCKTK